MEHAAVAAGHIAFERRGALGLVRLTRPDALNALTHDMVRAMAATLDGWAADDGMACVAVTGEAGPSRRAATSAPSTRPAWRASRSMPSSPTSTR